MNYRLTNLLSTLGLLLTLCIFSTNAHAQFVPTGPTTLFVDATCVAPLDVGSGPTFTSDSTGFTFNYSPALTGYQLNDPIPAGTNVDVTYIVTYPLGSMDTFSYQVIAADTVPPVFDNVPNDTLLTCFETIPPSVVVTATDDCDGPIDVSLVQSTTQTTDGTCGDTDYQITRIWTAMDDSGNISIDTQTVTVTNLIKPIYSTPRDTIVSCEFSTPAFTGDITAADVTACGNVQINFSDSQTVLACPNNVLIERTWTVGDGCADSISVQMITLIDTIPPTFMPTSGDTVVSCDLGLNLTQLGKPIALQDNCSAPQDISVYIGRETQMGNICANGYIFERSWFVDDACGNRDSVVLLISVVDTVAPTITIAAQDENFACATNAQIDDAFSDWVDNRGGAVATDNCSSNLLWNAYNAGTSNGTNLPAAMCSNTPNGVYRQQAVDFVVLDECGNQDTTTAVFTAIDMTPPLLISCPTDTILFADVATCGTDFLLFPPTVSEGCGSSTSSESPPTQTRIGFGLPGNPSDVIVSSETFTFGVSPFPVIASDSMTFEVFLNNMDAEEPTEFFNIFDENGVLLGQTLNTPTQCDSVRTTFRFPVAQVNAWSADGSITFTLSPNIPAGLPGRFAINPICPGLRVIEASISYPTIVPNGLTYEYAINGGTRIDPGSITSSNETFDVGVNNVTYYLTDCAGNQDSCGYDIVVIDNVPPVFSCPSDVILFPATDECSVDYTLPFPSNVSDNCAVGNMITFTEPMNPADALLTFTADPNLNDYLADDKSFSFTNVGGNAIQNVDITVLLQADALGTGAFYTIFDEDNNSLFTVQGTDCNTPNEVVFTIIPQAFNSWASDGVVSFTAVSNTNIPVPPGSTGDGINPCDASMVTANGDNDGTSFMTLSISYNEATPSYYATGATTIATTQMQGPDFMPVETLNAGTTRIFYLIEDNAGNVDTCSYFVSVNDTQMPTAMCAPSFVVLNPSGAVTDTIFPSEIDFGSFDNCGIDSMFVTPNILTCNSDTLTVTLTVLDAAGNQATCQALVGVTTEKPQPTYTVDCNNNTLQLFTNPPVAIGGIAFTYEWSGPNNFVAFTQNPIIQSADGTDAGFYSVEITGVTGCTAEGVIEVLQSDLPPATPDFFVVQNSVCSTDNIVMTASNPAGNGQVQYIWYLENPGNDIPLDTTSSPFFSMPAPVVSGSYCFYVSTIRNNCLSLPSITRCVQVTQSPTAMLASDNITVCEGEGFVLEAVLPLPGPGVNFEFIGPGGSQNNTNFQFAINNPTVNDSGTYLLTAYKNGCQSNTVMASVFVNAVPNQPEITSNSPVCLGDTLTLLTNVPQAATYIWTAPDFTEFSTNEGVLKLPNANVTYNGNWRVRVETQQNCTSVNSQVTNVVINNLPIIAASVDNNPPCANEDIQLSANQIVNSIYQWSGPANFSAGTRTVNAPPVAGFYNVTVTDQNGCSATDDVVVILQNAPSIIGVAASDNDCPSGPEDVTLKALLSDNTQDYDFAWSGAGFNSTDSCAVIQNATMADNGSYQVIVTGANGCADTSAVQVNMGNIINTPQAPSSSNGNMLCAGEALTLTTSATFPSTNVTWYWITPTGTIPTSTSTLIINPTTTANTGSYRVYAEVGNCFSDTSGVLLVTVSPAPVTTVTCANCPVCEGDNIMLSADCNIPGATYEWTSDTGFNSTICAPLIPNADETLHEGTYSVRVRVNGCWSAPATVFVSVNERPNNPQAAENGPYCVSTAPITLNVTPSTATPGSTYRWFLIENGGSTEVGSTFSTTFPVPNSASYTDGTYNFYVVSEINGCFSQQSPEVTVSVSTIPNNQAFAGNDLFVCEEDEINLNADAPTIGTGLWTSIPGNPTGANVTNPDEATTSVSGLIPGNIYNYSWSLSNGACVNYSIDTTQITVSLVELADAGMVIQACSVTEVNLDAVQPTFGNGTWTQPAVQEMVGVTIVSPNDPNTLITGLVPGSSNNYIFTWTIPDNGCGDDSNDVVVQVANDTSDAGDDINDCGFGCSTLSAVNPEVGTGAWSSPDPAISFNNVNNQNAEVCGLSNGDNTLIWILNNGSCGEVGIDTVIISYQLAPIAADDIFTIPFAGVEDLTLTENDDISGNFFSNIITEPEHGRIVETAEGQYTFTADINFVGLDFFVYQLCAPNCECTEAIVNLSIGGEAGCDIPTIITPNNDGINDAFVVPCLAEQDKFPNNNVSIFNQWGDEVFRASPYQNNWSGTYSGQDLPVGTYFFIVDFGNNTKPKNGFLVINR